MFENLFLQAENPGGGWPFFVTMMCVMGVFYFFMIRPQQKKQKEQQGFSESLAKGVEVVTASGIIGRINKIDGNIITLDLGNKNYVRMTRSAISKDMTEAHLGGVDGGDSKMGIDKKD